MPVTPTYPGVYIEEVPSGVRTIVGVATSITAFIGNFSRGSMTEARRVFNREEFDREYGGLRKDSLASYAITQFFLNGGTQAWIARTASDTPQKSTVMLQDVDGADSFLVEAINEGSWGDNLWLEIDHGTTEPDTTFNLRVLEIDKDKNVLRTEEHPNLTMTAEEPRSVAAAIENDSKLIRVSTNGSSGKRPAQTGTVSGKITAAALPAIAATDTLQAVIGGNGGTEAIGSAPTTLPAIASALQKVIRKQHDNLRNVNVVVRGSASTGAFLQVTAGTSDAAAIVELDSTVATALGFGPGTRSAQYQALGTTQTGTDGGLPDATSLTDTLDLLEKVDLFNILCIPDTDRLADNDAESVAAAATTYVQKRRAFYILDPPNVDSIRDEPDEIVGWLDGTTLRHKNVALYYPRPRIADPLNEYRLKTVPASGTIAGLYSRTDAERGVWVAPAGTDAPLRGVQELEFLLTDDQNGIVNPLGINALRQFRVYGRVCWGSRTLDGADQLTSEWKYIPVRRLALFLEESLYRGTQFAVHEPNDEPLWSQLRLAAGTFMQDLFRHGAFQGKTPREAYLVKCDAETTTQSDIDKGIVNVLVGFAPLKPAEFVIIRIQQLAGQNQA